MASLRAPRWWFAGAFLGLLALVPIIAWLGDYQYHVTLFSRIMIYGLAALGLNLILGFGGLVSFGHALYLGIGAYAVGILSFHGISSGFVQLGAALLCGMLTAVVIGLVCLRTSGMAFIMITLAFAQMFYFLAVSLKQYGGDDGMPIRSRSDFGVLSLDHGAVLYYLVFTLLMLVVYASNRAIHSRFGLVLQGCRVNERRMIALGFPTLRYKLAAYVISAQVCVLAGILIANLTRYTSPAYMQWMVSGDLIVMIVLGGMQTVLGPLVGSAALAIIEDALSGFQIGLPWELDAFVSDHWTALLGIFIVVVVLRWDEGLYGSIVGREDNSTEGQAKPRCSN
jgi:branched-chain amino acid transport system permease protein